MGHSTGDLPPKFFFAINFFFPFFVEKYLIRIFTFSSHTEYVKRESIVLFKNDMHNFGEIYF